MSTKKETVVNELTTPEKNDNNPIKVAVMNYSGNVGKSTLCEALFYPRMNIDKKDYIKIETINSDKDGEGVSAKHFDQLISAVMFKDSCLIDVGSSNIEEFVRRMISYKGSHDEIDYYILPVTPDEKQAKDTVSIRNFLVSSGVEESRIKIILNMVERSPFDKESELIDFEDTALCNISNIRKLPVIYKSPYYPELMASKYSHLQILEMGKDRNFRAEKMAAKDKDERWKIVNQSTLYKAACAAEDNLSDVYKQLDLV